jgi:molecular chaperone HtpG
MTTETHKETKGFQAEIKQLLDIIIHSFYSKKEIFLRELISNASDAIDRLRFAALSDGALLEQDTELHVHVAYDKDARTITVTDNGIGMSREEVIEHIGTIAKSGTREFFQSLTGDQQKDANLIGQFGVGFYASFVVADRVTLMTRRAGLAADQGVRWESDGLGEYMLEAMTRPGRGTAIVLHLRDGEDELLNGYRLRSIIKKYSDHIVVPVVMKAEEKDEEERVNSAAALWTRPKSEISKEEYNEFYKQSAHDVEDPLASVHSRMEGTQEYILLLYVPARAPFDLWNREQRHGVKLYVRRVFILDDAAQLMPTYLRFVRGIVDSSDLPLNVSREMLQHNKLIDTIRSNAVKKVLGLLSDLASNEPEKYTIFWKECGRVLKEGMVEDRSNHQMVAKLLRFASTATGNEAQDVSFESYIARMKEGQEKMFYLIADSHAAAARSPLLEIFKRKGVEVLLLSDPVDHLLTAELSEFDGKHLQSISRGEVDLGKIKDAEEQPAEEQHTVSEPDALLKRLREALKEQVKDVRVSTRLTDSPVCLVVDEYDMDPSLLRLLKASGQHMPAMKPILEINAHHPVMLKVSHVTDEQTFTDWAFVLFDQSKLTLGEQLDDPVGFVSRLNGLLAQM